MLKKIKQITKIILLLILILNISSVISVKSECRWETDATGYQYEVCDTQTNSGTSSTTSLNPNIKKFNISSEQTCWMSKDGRDKGPNLISILNPGNWLPIMYKCETTTPDGRPIPLHPINLWPIGVRLFAFVLSLLIWLTVAAIIVGIALFALNTAKNVLVLIKKAIVGAILIILILIFMYAILSTIISLLG